MTPSANTLTCKWTKDQLHGAKVRYNRAWLRDFFAEEGKLQVLADGYSLKQVRVLHDQIAGPGVGKRTFYTLTQGHLDSLERLEDGSFKMGLAIAIGG